MRCIRWPQVHLPRTRLTVAGRSDQVGHAGSERLVRAESIRVGLGTSVLQLREERAQLVMKTSLHCECCISEVVGVRSDDELIHECPTYVNGDGRQPCTNLGLHALVGECILVAGGSEATEEGDQAADDRAKKFDGAVLQSW